VAFRRFSWTRHAVLMASPHIQARKFTEGDDHERVAETRDHRVRGWHGSDELPPGRARPRL